MIIGIVAAKAHSNRFQGKNEVLLRGEPLFWHSVRPLLEADSVQEVVVSTDSETIHAYCVARGVAVHWRHRNGAHDEEPLLRVLRTAYVGLDQSYEAVATIMANCPGHRAETVDRAVAHLRDRRLREVRSFNAAGEESGLMVFREDVVLNASEVSTYIGAITSDVREIHLRSDLDDVATG